MNANIIMKVSGSASARAIEEYLRYDALRLIFLKALPIIKVADYKTKPSLQNSPNAIEESKSELYLQKISKLE
jgi:hypothetical protein